MVRIPILFAFVLAAGCVVGEDIESDNPPGANPDGGGGGDEADAAPMSDGGPTGGDGGDVPEEQRILQDFGECMTRADFDANNIVDLASLPAGQNDQPCSDCHAGGQNNNYMNQDPALMFENIRTCTSYPGNCYILKYAMLDEQLNPVVSTALADKAEVSLNNHNGGEFTIPQGNLDDIQAFYDATLANYNEGNCGASQ